MGVSSDELPSVYGQTISQRVAFHLNEAPYRLIYHHSGHLSPPYGIAELEAKQSVPNCQEE